MEPGIRQSLIDQCRDRFESNPKHRLARNVCTKHNLLDIMRSRQIEESTNHVYTHKIETEGKPTTNQKSSGRCWIFACLNCMRLPVMKKWNVEEFQFSQNYLFFWDKVERFHYQLRVFVASARAGDAADGRVVAQLMSNPSEDGGQWHMLVNVVEKYGVMPRACFPDTNSSDNSRRFNLITNNKMREYCLRLRQMVEEGAGDDKINTAIDDMVEEIFTIVSICLGTPPTTFTWEYYDKDKKYVKVGPITPKDFYEQYVKPEFNMLDKVVFVNDPRPSNSYNKVYTIQYLGNMVGGVPVKYINQDIAVLKRMAADSIKNNEAVWFGSDVEKHCAWKALGIEDMILYDYELVFGTSILNMSKSDRLQYRDSLMTHAMVLTAFSEQDDGSISKWRIENSWGEDGGQKGYLLMTDDWFSEFVYEVVVDKKFVPEEILKLADDEPIELPVWDPMGVLAGAGSRHAPV